MKKIKAIIIQLIKFSEVGVICFVVDFVILHILMEYCNISVLISAAIGFTVSVIINYYLSVKYVFSVDRNKRKLRNFILFIILSVVGLIITELIMKVGVGVLLYNYMAVKIISTAVVMIFNFVTRKIFLEKDI